MSRIRSRPSSTSRSVVQWGVLDDRRSTAALRADCGLNVLSIVLSFIEYLLSESASGPDGAGP